MRRRRDCDDYCDDCDDCEDDRPRPRLPWVLLGVGVGGAAVLCLLLGACLLVGLGGSALPDNARCPACNREFRIPEEHRGTVAEATRRYACPNCGASSPPAWLYKERRAR